jgi:hypothetical protein
MPIESPRNLGNINNFVPKMTAFGVSVFERREDWEGKPKRVEVGRRPYTNMERAALFSLGARGGYIETSAFAIENGIEKEFAKEVVLQTHITKPAFTRMRMLFAELTEALMAQCLEEERYNQKPMDEELFVAYSLMAKLTDVTDPHVVKEGSSVDTWYLCH